LSDFTQHFSLTKERRATSGAARKYFREESVTDVVRFHTLAILHKDHFDVTGQFLVLLQQDIAKYLLLVGINKF